MGSEEEGITGKEEEWGGGDRRKGKLQSACKINFKKLLKLKKRVIKSPSTC